VSDSEILERSESEILEILGLESGAQAAFHFRGNFHELSFDDVIVLIQLWYNFFANGHR